MGLLDVLTGRRRLAGPAADRLFAITTAYVTMQSGYGMRSRGSAAIGFVDDRDRPLYWIYNYKRGRFSPFAPAGGADGRERDHERELVARAQMSEELPVEPEVARWFALWGIPI